jgi:nucleoside-diphosphate-sugar epimerase
MENILITGGSGFIGTNLVQSLLCEGKLKVINLDIAEPLIAEHREYWQKVDLMDAKSLRDAIARFKPDYIVHLAARTDTNSNVLADYAINTQGTENLLAAVKAANCVKRLIITSTQYVYRSRQDPFPRTDDTYAPHTTYGESKRLAEEITRHAGLTCVWTIVRPTNVWGPWHMRYPNELWKMLDKRFYFHPGKTPVIRTYAYVKNVVFQIRRILELEAPAVDKQTFYLGDLPINSLSWINALSRGFCDAEVVCLPRVLMKGLALAGDVLRLFGLRFPMYGSRYRNMVEDYYAPTNIAVRELGLACDNLDANVAETIAWLKGDGAVYFDHWRERKWNTETRK